MLGALKSVRVLEREWNRFSTGLGDDRGVFLVDHTGDLVSALDKQRAQLKRWVEMTFSEHRKHCNVFRHDICLVLVAPNLRSSKGVWLSLLRRVRALRVRAEPSE